MALRINQSVISGEIDNRQRGRVKVTLCLVGREHPVKMELVGNCLRDLAGCLVKFTNPHRKPDETAPLAAKQIGIAGEITASRKVRVFDVLLEEALAAAKAGVSAPEHMANALYLEWFSEANGRVVIESADYTVEISSAAWTLSPQEERAQIEASHQALRDWLDRIDPSDESYKVENDKPMDEFDYEKFLRESDAPTDKYCKLLEKYARHPDQEKIVAREMAWEWLEDALEADERGALPRREEIEYPPLVPNPLTEGIDWIRDDDGHIHHPLTRHAFERAMAMWHFCKERRLLEDSGDVDLHEMIFQFQVTSAKIAGALDSLAYDAVCEGGFIVACLKRALSYLNNSIATAERVGQKKLLPTERLERHRADLFQVRQQILQLMQRFRN